MTLFVDMDGVLADFDAHHEVKLGWRPDKAKDDVDWEKVRAVGDFYLTMPPMADLSALWACLAPFKPIVLTGVPKLLYEEASANKRGWALKHLGPDVEVRCCRSKDKALHAAPGDILIDDWEKHMSRWLRAGGIWITHTSAADTIRQHQELKP